MSSVDRGVSLVKLHQYSSNTELISVFCEGGYLADDAEMGFKALWQRYPDLNIRDNRTSRIEMIGEG